MRIDHCPKCGKAGLKIERYPSSPYSNPPKIPTVEQGLENGYHWKAGEKWCPRCKEWVTPIDKPYIGGRN